MTEYRQATGDIVVDNTAAPDKVVATVPTLEEVWASYDPPLVPFSDKSDPNKQVVAIATAVYNSVVPDAYDSHRRMIAYAAWDLGPNNLWILRSKERLAYPFNCLYAIASLFKTERARGRRADWLFWHDDDVIVPPDIIRQLYRSADPEDRPFVAAVGHDRNPPYNAACCQMKNNGEGLEWHQQWIDPPSSGVHRVATTGLCAALFHRSFFDRVPQPWFVSVPPQVAKTGFMAHKINTDGWLSQQCRDNDVPIHVNCDVKITHIGARMPVNSTTAPILRQVFPADTK